MKSDRFEWDDRKAASNRRKHGVSFEEARAVFADRHGFERLDPEEMGEERLLLTGTAGWRLLTAVFAYRGGRVRIVSARKATRNEQSSYFDETA
jgi:hypothetical protein